MSIDVFRVYTKTYGGTGMKDVYLPLFPSSVSSTVSIGSALPEQLALDLLEKKRSAVADLEEALPFGNFVSEKALEQKRQKNIHDVANRVRKTVYGIAVCNEWSHFVTITVSSIHDRTDLEFAFDQLRLRLRLLKNWYPGFKYLFVPEYHARVEANGKRAVHFHGLVCGLPKTEFGCRSTYIRDKKSHRIYKRKVNDLKIFRDLGISDISPVRSQERVTAYIAKYVSKEIIRLDMHRSSYIVSRGLRRPERHRYTLRADQVDMFRCMMRDLLPETFECMYGTRYTLHECYLFDEDFFSTYFMPIAIYDDD